jgi:hypothetical protein
MREEALGEQVNPMEVESSARLFGPEEKKKKRR